MSLQGWLSTGGRSVGPRGRSENLAAQNFNAKSLRANLIALDLATVLDDKATLFTGRISLFEVYLRLCKLQEAEAMWRLIDHMGRDWPWDVYRQGGVEDAFACLQFCKGTLQEEHLTTAAIIAEQNNNRSTLRHLHWLRGAWRLEQQDWLQAAASFQEGVRMARERRLMDADSETGLAYAKFNLHQLNGDEARSEAERLAQQRRPAHRYLALLWLAIDDPNQAKKHALEAYKRAWADGEPYVNAYELTKMIELLRQMNIPIPQLQGYDPANDEPFPWEADVGAAIEKVRAKTEAKKNAQKH